MHLFVANTDMLYSRWAGLEVLHGQNNIRDILVLSVSIRVSDSARILRVVVDSRLTMANHVSSLCRSVYYQLRQLRITCITEDSAKMVVQAFVSSRLD